MAAMAPSTEQAEAALPKRSRLRRFFEYCRRHPTVVIDWAF